ncbi:phenylalanine--tRNA ligase subunit alpha [Candidatus Pacearchaeota archaeon]|nr:MAG: phenylalanine--tRNA ligase subunit alpha [Candidatus Pacearchaeota archaeon]
MLPLLKLSVREIKESTGLDDTSLLRALKLLDSKGIIKLELKKVKVVELGTNGIYYSRHGLPERRLLQFLDENAPVEIDKAKSGAGLTDNEFKASLGVLREKGFAQIRNGKIFLQGSREQHRKKMDEEVFLESLPTEESKLSQEERAVLRKLARRKDIIEVKTKSLVNFEITQFGKEVAQQKLDTQLLEEVTPELIKEWKRGQKFRRYDLRSTPPKIFGGRRHFISEIVEEMRRAWVELGFVEMTGNKAETSFWAFDALFTPQDHAARELQDTFFLSDVAGSLPSKQLVRKVKQAHEKGVAGSKGWRYAWREEIARKVCLRTHTTALSARTLAQLDLEKTQLPKRFFAIGRVFRNETIDSSHLFEFNQTEGIVVDEKANLRELLGYLKLFLRKFGFERVRFRPHYFPYTEPSVEADVWSEAKGKWIEILGAGIFRPEVVVPLLGKYVPVLAWGMGVDRLAMERLGIADIRELYANDLGLLRERRLA